MIRRDFSRDFYLSAREAEAYGLVDKILLPKGKETLRSDLQFGLGSDAPPAAASSGGGADGPQTA